MKQLDVDVSPPGFVWNPYLTLANVTFDLDPFDLDHRENSQILDNTRQTDRQTESNAYEPTRATVQLHRWAQKHCSLFP